MTCIADVKAKLLAAYNYPDNAPALISEAPAALDALDRPRGFPSLWQTYAVRRHEIRDAKGFAAKWFHAGYKAAKNCGDANASV